MKYAKFIGFSVKVGSDYAWNEDDMSVQREARAAQTYRRAGEEPKKQKLTLEQQAKRDRDWERLMLLRDNYKFY